MSLNADMEALLQEKMARVSQLEIQQLKYVSRIKELEQELNTLKADKRPSADGQVGVSTNPSEPVLRAEIVQLQTQIAAKDATIEERGEQVTALLAIVRSYREAFGHDFVARFVAFTTSIGTFIQSKLDEGHDELPKALTVTIEKMKRELRAEGASKESELSKGQTAEEVPISETDISAERQPQKEQTTRASNTAGEEPAEQVPTPPPKGTQVDIQGRPHTPVLPQVKSPADSASESTLSSQASYSQALQAPREKLKGRGNPLRQKPAVSITTHAEFSAKREAEQHAHSGAQRPQLSQQPNKASAHGVPIGRGDGGRGHRDRGRRDRGRRDRGHGGRGAQISYQASTAQSPIADANPTESSTRPESSKVVVPANHGKRAELGVTTAEDMNQPSRKLEVDVSVATAKAHTGQDIPDYEHLDKEALKQIEIQPEILPGFTAFDVMAFKKFGKPLPWEEDEEKAAVKLVALPVLTTQQPTSKVFERDPGASDALKASCSGSPKTKKRPSSSRPESPASKRQHLLAPSLFHDSQQKARKRRAQINKALKLDP